MTNEPKRRGRPPGSKNRPKEAVEQTGPVLEQEPLSLPAPLPLKVHIWPSFGGEDKGEGGIRRVVEAQIRHLPAFNIEIVHTAEEADVIAYHAEVPNNYVNKFPDKPFVAMCHGFYWSEYEWDNWSLKANEKVMEGIRVADSIITCSDWVANAIRRHTSREVTVIPHGVDLADWQNDLASKDYVLWNKTRPDPVCDPADLDQLAALMPNQRFVSTFVKTKRINIAETGRLPYEDAKKLIQQAGVYLCTTRETFGIGTLEALAAGVPVVGYDFGGQGEFIEHKVDGWLVQPGDIDGLAEGVRWALENREKLSANCIAKAKQFSWERAAEQYASIFGRAYQSKHSKGPRTSIIVTNYNLHDYLTECLESVRNQTDGDFECIVVDDFSPDGSGRDIARGYADRDSRFRFIENEQNLYLAEARNAGIRMARGRYILPLDADDMLAPDAVKLLADSLDSDRSIHVAYGNVQFRNEDGVTLTDYSGYYGKDQKFEPGHSSWPFPFVHEQQIRQMNLLPYCSMYRREAWRQTGGYRRRCRTAEDADMWTRFSSYGFRPKLVTDQDTLIYRNRDGSMSRKQGDTPWIRWFSWTKIPEITPAGAITREQLPVASLDPIIVSVIIPCGPGHEKYVLDAIDSVDTQSFRNWECIVVNDTGEEFPMELPSWVRVIRTEGSKGPAHARNVGIKAMRGRLFLPLDADDYLQPDALTAMHEAYKLDKEVIYSDFYQTDMTGKQVSIHHCDDYDPNLVLGGRRNVNGEVRQGLIHTVTALTPKIYWEQVGGYDENLPAWEDWDFQIALANIGVCERRVAYPLFMYRKHTGLRREQNYENFQEGKEAILAKWGNFFEKGDKLMACGACQARRSLVPTGNVWSMAAPRIAPNTEAKLVHYKGDKQGSMQYRGAGTRTLYIFGYNDTKLVLAQDLATFLGFPDEFEIVQPEVKVTEEDFPLMPVLMADGAPA